MIQLSRVSKLYGKVIGVNDLTIEVKSGAYGLVGPNGSGKTTLINLITGQLRPTLGGVRVFDRDPWRDRSVLKQIGLCPATARSALVGPGIGRAAAPWRIKRHPPGAALTRSWSAVFAAM